MASHHPVIIPGLIICIWGDRTKALIILCITIKTLKIGTPEIITIIVLQLEQLDFTVQYYIQKMQTE